MPSSVRGTQQELRKCQLHYSTTSLLSYESPVAKRKNQNLNHISVLECLFCLSVSHVLRTVPDTQWVLSKSCGIEQISHAWHHTHSELRSAYYVSVSWERQAY